MISIMQFNEAFPPPMWWCLPSSITWQKRGQHCHQHN